MDSTEKIRKVVEFSFIPILFFPDLIDHLNVNAQHQDTLPVSMWSALAFVVAMQLCVYFLILFRNNFSQTTIRLIYIFVCTQLAAYIPMFYLLSNTELNSTYTTIIFTFCIYAQVLFPFSAIIILLLDSINFLAMKYAQPVVDNMFMNYLTKRGEKICVSFLLIMFGLILILVSSLRLLSIFIRLYHNI